MIESENEELPCMQHAATPRSYIQIRFALMKGCENIRIHYRQLYIILLIVKSIILMKIVSISQNPKPQKLTRRTYINKAVDNSAKFL